MSSCLSHSICRIEVGSGWALGLYTACLWMHEHHGSQWRSLLRGFRERITAATSQAVCLGDQKPLSEIPPVLLGIPWQRLWEALSGTTSEKRRLPSRTGGGDSSENALEPSNALNYRAWGIPAVLSRGMPGKAMRVFVGAFRNLSGISSGKSQPYWGYVQP